MNRIGLLAGLTIFALLSPARAADMEESAYYPLKVGSTWTYKIPDTPGAPRVVIKVMKHEKIGDLQCARLETFVNDKSMAYEYVTVTKDAVLRVKTNEFKSEPPLKLLQLPPKKGDTWKVDGKVSTETIKGTYVVSEEKIEVPAGKYDTFLSVGTLDASGMKLVTSNYFAKGVGIVKLKVSGIMGMTVVLDLEKFEAGK